MKNLKKFALFAISSVCKGNFTVRNLHCDGIAAFSALGR